MKHRHLMQQTGGICPILSLRSTHVTILPCTRETGDIHRDGVFPNTMYRKYLHTKVYGVKELVCLSVCYKTLTPSIFLFLTKAFLFEQQCVQQAIDFPVYATKSMLTLGSLSQHTSCVLGESGYLQGFDNGVHK